MRFKTWTGNTRFPVLTWACCCMQHRLPDGEPVASSRGLKMGGSDGLMRGGEEGGEGLLYRAVPRIPRRGSLGDIWGCACRCSSSR